MVKWVKVGTERHWERKFNNHITAVLKDEADVYRLSLSSDYSYFDEFLEASSLPAAKKESAERIKEFILKSIYTYNKLMIDAMKEVKGEE